MLARVRGLIRANVKATAEGVGWLPMSQAEMLWDLTRPKGLEGWRVLSDGDLGGFSSAELAYCAVRRPEEDEALRAAVEAAREAAAAELDDASEEDWTTEEQPTYESGMQEVDRAEAALAESTERVGYAEFAGELSTDVSGQMVRSGFVSMQPESADPPLNLIDFEGLQLRVRTCGRPYLVTVRSDGWQEDALYMGGLMTPAGEWHTVELGFQDLVLTCNGFVMEDQMVLDNPRIERVGFTLADNEDGPFKLDVAWIKAVRTLGDVSDSDGEGEEGGEEEEGEQGEEDDVRR